MRPWKVALLVGALAVVGLLTAVAIASGADKAAFGVRDGGGAQCDGDGVQHAGEGSGGSGGMTRGAAGSVETQQIAEEHAAAMQDWYQRYGDDPNSPEACSALRAIRDEHRAEMQQLGGGRGLGAAAEDCDSADCAGSANGGECGEHHEGYGEGLGNGKGNGAMGDGNGW
jgi:hypothetical protein